MRQISPMGAGRASSMTLRINGIQPDELRPQSPENRDKQTLAQMQQRSEKHAVQTPVQSAANVGNPPLVSNEVSSPYDAKALCQTRRVLQFFEVTAIMRDPFLYLCRRMGTCRKIAKTPSNLHLVNPMLPLRKQNTRFGDIYPSLYKNLCRRALGFQFSVPI